MTKRVLITGARAPVALELSRRFAREGAEVFLADSIGMPGARFSFSVRRYVRLPAPIDDPPAYADALAAAVREHGIDLVVPTCEEIYYVARFADRIPCRVFADSFETLDRLHNKHSFARLVRSEHADVPRSELVRGDIGGDDLRRLVLKPVYSRFAASTLRSPSEDEFARVRTEKREWLAQERVYGTEYSTYGVADRGRLLAHACYHSEYRVDGGSGVLFKNVSAEKTRILAFVRELVAQIGFTGQIGFDLIEAEDGRTYVLECNPRATSGVHLFAPDDDRLARAILDPDSVPETAVAAGIGRKLAFALVFTEEVSRFHVGRWPRLVADSIRTPDAVFEWRDPLPFAAAGLSLSEIILIAIRKRKKLTAAATHDIEFDGQPL
jgi:predicted ATP-grasp superfamily ATP-dependent carboligase